MPIRTPRQPVLPEHTAFSKLGVALQLTRHERLLETRPTIGCRSKPARPGYQPLGARAQPRFAKTRGAAVPCLTATVQMLSTPAIRRGPTTATINSSLEGRHAYLLAVASAKAGERLLPFRYDDNVCRHRYDELVSAGISPGPFFNGNTNRV